MQRLVVAVIAHPELGCDENLLAVNPTLLDSLTYLLFLEVSGGSVDEPIALGDSDLDASTVSSGPL